MKKIGLYIHIPFCESKCHYCDFYSITKSNSEIKKAYLEALKEELKLYKEDLDGCKFNTIFIGGGTPSSIDSHLYEDLFSYIKNQNLLDNYPEISMEVNPKKPGQDFLNKIKEIGVNRLSVGIQTFDDIILRIIGRNHNQVEAKTFLENVNKVGFDNLSCDLIFNLPMQKISHIKNDIDTLERYGVKHISLYSLKVNPNTRMNEIIKDENYILMDEDEERETYYEARNYLEVKKFKQYEISNFSKAGFESKHNLKYWNREEYIGIGASAHSYFKNKRYSNVSNVTKYIKMIKENKLPLDFEEYIGKEEAMWEYLILGLRKTEGISIKEFEEIFKISFEFYKEKIDELLEDGLLEKDRNIIRLTKKGMDLSNYVFVKLK